MGSEHSTGKYDVPHKLEAHQLMSERDLEETPTRKTSSDMDKEMVKAHSDEGSASQIVPQEEEANSLSLPAEETGVEELQEDSQECGQPLSLSQSASSDKGQPTRQMCKLDIATPPVEHSTEKAEYTTPQIPPKAADEPEAEMGVILLPSEDQSLDAELQKTVEDLHCLAESIEQKTCEISTWSPTKKEQDSENQTTIQSKSDYGSFELIGEIHPEPVATVEEHSSMTTALVIQPLEAQSSAAEELNRAEMAPLPTSEAEVDQSKGCSEVDAQTTEGTEDQTASEILKEADREPVLAQQALDAPAELLASNAVEHADTEFIDAIQNDEGYLSTEALSLVEEHPTTATVQDPESEPLLDHLAEPSSMVMQEPDEAKEPSLMKKLVEASSDPAAIEMTEAQVTKLDTCPQPGHVSCTDIKLAPVAQETESVATADVEAQTQGSPGAQQDSTKGLAHARKQESKFPKTFYCCCSPCNAGEGEGNAEQ